MLCNDLPGRDVALIQELGAYLVENSEGLPLRPSDVELMADLGRQLVALAQQDDIEETDGKSMEQLGRRLLGSARTRRPARPTGGFRIGTLDFRTG